MIDLSGFGFSGGDGALVTVRDLSGLGYPEDDAFCDEFFRGTFGITVRFLSSYFFYGSSSAFSERARH